MFGSDIGASFVIGRFVGCEPLIKLFWLVPRKMIPGGPRAACFVSGQILFLPFVLTVG